jgi:peroxiredoxin
MNTLNYKFRIILVVMLLGISFSGGATVESDAVQAAKGKTKEQVAAIVKAAAKANPALAASIALAVVKSQPAFAAAIAAAAAAGAPANAAAIVTAVVKEVPKSATVIAKEVVSAVPSKAGAITNAAVRSAPDAAGAITEAVVTQILSAALPVAQPSTARSESTTNNISVTQNVITTHLENKITACGTDSQCKVNASVSAVQASGSTNATLLGLLASAIITKVQQITHDESLISNIKASTLQAAASAS